MSAVAGILLLIGLAPPAAPTWPGDNGKVFFIRDDQIYKVNPNGSGLAPVTDDTASYTDPALSPNGRRLSVTRFEGMGVPQIYRIRTDGTGQHQVTEGASAVDSAWTANGKRIVYTRNVNGNLELFVVRIGDEPRVGRRLTDSPGHEFSPEVSPNGKWVAFTYSVSKGQGEIVKMHLDGTGRRRVTDTEEKVEQSPTWAPSGRRIAFSSNPKFRDNDIASIRPDGTGRKNLTRTDDFNEIEPSWSPNGEWIAARSLRMNNSDTRIVRFRSNDGRPIERITTFAIGGSSPAWNVAQN
jgi:Tol biopolymer transport system component